MVQRPGGMLSVARRRGWSDLALQDQREEVRGALGRVRGAVRGADRGEQCSERVVIFGLGQDGRERARLTVGFSELELARTISRDEFQ